MQVACRTSSFFLQKYNIPKTHCQTLTDIVRNKQTSPLHRRILLISIFVLPLLRICIAILYIKSFFTPYFLANNIPNSFRRNTDIIPKVHHSKNKAKVQLTRMVIFCSQFVYRFLSLCCYNGVTR